VQLTIEGYCTAEGESNVGKTAMVRALHAALSNRTGTEFIPDNMDSCGVKIEALEPVGHVLEWEKDRKSTTYRIDGQEIGKASRGAVPEEIKIIGISAIRTLDKELHWPQIHFQWDQPFIIGAYTDTVAAELLGASLETSKITRAIKLVNGDVAKCKTKAEILESQYKGLSTTVQVMEEIATRINTSQQVVDQHEKARNESSKKENTYKNLVYQYRLFWGKWKIANALSKMVIPVPPDCSGYEALREIHQRYTQTVTLIDMASRSKDTVPAIPDGRQRVVDLVRLCRDSERVSRRIELLHPVAQAPAAQRPDWSVTADRLQALTLLKDQFLRTHKEMESSKRVLSEISQEAKGIEEERRKIEYVVGTMERCPLCAAPMRAGRYCEEEAHNG
jgi:hypothetical protein